MQAYGYWSATSSVTTASNAWLVNFGGDDVVEGFNKGDAGPSGKSDNPYSPG